MSALTPEEWDAIGLSLWVAVTAAGFSLPFAVAAAWVLAKTRFAGRLLFDALVHLPLVLPPVVTGYGLLLLFGRNGAIGAFLADTFGIVFAFRWTGAALASAVMAFPLMVRAIRLAMEAVDAKYEAAAATLGAGRLRVFATVTLPLSARGVIAGLVLAFAKSLGEFGATITFVSNIPGQTQTLPTLIYTLMQTPAGDAPALRLAVIAVVISLSALVVSEWFARKSRAALPRPARPADPVL